ncbi:carbohydrate ABC transporter permease [Lachnoclostridium sp. Marseille-P6806]|uniref:carbohydrate ABC transporter permease n=1 Tax=Lachnoclostridium sp. Marseille-P6806 TaxID=2364793 RepID=UPI0010304DCF|nr:sugar ABC transporter permease [Lachnoclostridium sp. Marseille-P6806]
MKLKGKSRAEIAMLLLPGLLIFGTFTIYPIVRLFWMSFCGWDFGSFLKQEFIGLSNYREVVTDGYFRTAFANTLAYTAVTVPAQMLLGLFVAMLIHSLPRGQIGFRVAYYLPVITSWVICSLVFRYVFNTEGLLNYFLTQVVHAAPQNIRWLDSRWGGMSVAMLLGIWKGIGWNMVVFLAALQTVPRELYESASLDGAGAWKKFVYVTLPGIRGTLLFALVMLTIGGFNVYTSTKLITDGKPGHETEVVLTWMYYKAFSTGKFGYAAALSFIIALVLAVLAVLQFRLMREKT